MTATALDEKEDPMPDAAAALHGRLSPPEFGIWLISRQNSEACNIHRVWELVGALDEDGLRAAVAEVVSRHAVFARRLSDDAGVPAWAPGAAVPSWTTADEAGIAPAQWAAAAGVHRFDLAQDCPVRIGLLRRGNERHLLSVLVHHVACDGVSLEILLEEISTAYAQRTAGGSPLPPAVSLPLETSSAVPVAATGYWPAQLADAQWPDALPCTPGPRTPHADTLRLALTAADTALIRGAARSLRATPHVLGLAALYAALAAHGSPSDAMIATPFAARTPQTAELVGCFARMVPLRQRWAAGDSGAALVSSVRRTVAEALAHSEEPIREVADLFDPSTPGVTVCFQAHGPLPAPVLPGVETTALEEDGNGLTRFDLEFDLRLGADGGALTLNRRMSGSAGHEAAGRLLRTFRNLLLSIARDPQLPLVRVAEAHRDEAELSVLRSPAPGARPRPLMERFADLVRAKPSEPAAVCGTESVSFAELDRAATRLAAILREHGAGPHTPVGVLAERGIPLVAAVLAVWRAGGYVVPLDPQQPDARLAFVVGDTRTRIVLRSPGLRHRLPGHPDVVELPSRVDTRPTALSGAAPDTHSGGPRALAYVIHTSGTTGRPKGVMVEQQGLAAYADAQPGGVRAGGAPASRVGLTGAVSFDAFFLQFLHLLRGSCLVVAEESVYRDPQALAAWTEQHGVQLLSITPSLFGSMCQFGFEEVLSRTGLELELGGEAVDRSTWDRLRELGVPGSNAYGPTEATIQTTACGFADTEAPSIGTPLAGTSCYVLGPDLRPVPRDVAGELYLSGEQVSRGYLDNPGLTADRFLPDPFAVDPGARMYRTGDRVRLTSGDRLQYLQRVDHQLKVRGQRVDPYEVEAALRGLPGVRDAYVARRIAAEEGVLCAYVLPDPEAGQPASPQVMRAAIARQLPPAAVPSHITVLDIFPLTSSGKLDESALPRVAADAVEQSSDDPVALLWQETVGVPPTDGNENFFACGGSSLDAARLVASLNRRCEAQIDLASFFRDPTPDGLRHRLRDAVPALDSGSTTPTETTEATEASAAAEAAEESGLSAAQRRLWLLHRADPLSHEFTVHWALRIRGPVDESVLARAWHAVVSAHPELLLRVLDDEQHPRRGLWDAEALALRSRAAAEAELPALLDRAARRTFDLFSEPLVELEAIRMATDDHVLLFTGHHLVLDRHSIQLITGQLLGALAGEAVPVSGRRPSQATDPGPGRQELLRAFWTAELDGVTTASPIASDGAEPVVRDQRGATVSCPISGAEWARLRETARSLRTTPLVLGMAAFALTADRHGATGDVLIGTTMDVRPPGFEDVVGLFVNPIPVRLRPHPSLTGGEFLASAHEALLRSHAHRDLPFDALVRELGLRAEPGRAPLFQVLIDYEPSAPAGSTPSGADVTPVGIPVAVAKYDLEIVLRETQEGACLDLVHRTDRWDAVRALEITRQVRGALLRLADVPELPAALPPDEDPARPTLAWGRGADLPARPRPVGSLVDDIARRLPDQVAAVAGDGVLTYGELRARALGVAARLGRLGIRRGDRVAVLARRSTAMLVAVLGAHFAGAAYVPLDPDHPDPRVRAALEDSGAAALLSTADNAERGRGLGLPVIDLDQPHDEPDTVVPVEVTAHDAAYVIYTSGSTGKPKGVVIEQGTLAASTAARHAVYPSGQVFLLLSPLAFDSSAAGIWGTLTGGGRVIIASSDEVRDPDRLIRLIELHQVTHLLCVPSLYAVLLRTAERTGTAALRSLCEIVVAGEPLPGSVLRLHFGLLPGSGLVNEYGPTEATVWSSFRRYTELGPIDIGGPVPGYRLHVLDHALRPAPPGVAGELYVGGAGVGRGYAGRPADTAAAFLPDAFSDEPGTRMYRTGDRVRWSEDGALVFLGRTDDQVKVRGHRIQPAEIEEVLRAVAGVRDAAVVAHSTTSLVAFVTGGADPDLVRRAAIEHLPAFMVPGRIHAVDGLPLTTNGKVDRRALEREAADRVLEAAVPLPGAPTARPQFAAVSAAWSEVLGMPVVPEDVNFFDVGGHSLLVPALQEALYRQTGVRLPILDLFRYSTVADIAARLRERTADTTPDPVESTGRSRPRGEAARRLRNRRAQEADQ